VLKVQDVVVDPATRRVWRDEREIVFSRKEFDLLHFLMQRAGSVVSRDELMLTVWNTTFWTSSKTIDVHLGWVRRKLGDDPSRPSLITTVHVRRPALRRPGRGTHRLTTGSEASLRFCG
jgi:DNA-binding response OmpR family regulator